MNKGITVRQLQLACVKAMADGNGDKQILITTDDEGNGYHTLWSLFNDKKDDIKYVVEEGLVHDNINPKDFILLG